MLLIILIYIRCIKGMTDFPLSFSFFPPFFLSSRVYPYILQTYVNLHFSKNS